MHVDQADLLAAVPDVIGDDRAVGDRIGVGHREYGGVSAQSSCCRTGFDILGVFSSGLAQMGVQIDEAGQQDLAGGIDDIGIVGYGQPGADVRDLSVGHQDVDLVALSVAPHPSDQNGVIAAPRVRSHTLIASPPRAGGPPAWEGGTPCSAPTSRWNNTAIRTCTPLETCCSTADCDESATENAISIPRTIGPGCSTTACSASLADRF